MTTNVHASGYRIALALVLLLALALRMGGLSHDLHLGEGSEYNPDIPKQVRAVERFLGGAYFSEETRLDYAGYPFFHAHIAEYALRLYAHVAAQVCRWIGKPDTIVYPDTFAIFWIMRWINVAVSTLAVALAFRIVRDIASRRVALIGALCCALSPGDIAAAHVGSGDTMAAFFALWCVERSLSVWRFGRGRDYVAAAVLAACAFGAKYHAVMCLSALGMAHLMRMSSVRKVLSVSSILKMFVSAAALYGAVFLVIPELRIEPDKMWENILGFLGHVSSGKRLEESERSLISRLLLSWEYNRGVMIHLHGLPVLAAPVAALIWAIRGHRSLSILLALPLSYFLLGVSIRPLSHATQHVLMTIPLLLVGTVVFARWYSASSAWQRPTAGALMLWTLWVLGRAAAHEVVMFQHADTRRLAREWAVENIPSSMDHENGRYSFDRDSDPHRVGPRGTTYSMSSISPHSDGPIPGIQMARFDVETDSLPKFRNPAIDVYIAAPEHLVQGFQRPPIPRIASPSRPDWILPSVPSFLADPAIWLVPSRGHEARSFLSTARVARAMAVVRAGPAPVVAELEFGHRTKTQSVAPGGLEVVWFDDPQTRLIRGLGRYRYRAEAKAQVGVMEVEWILDPLEQSAVLHQRQGGPDVHEGGRGMEASHPINEAEFFKRYGVSVPYLDALPYLHCSSADFVPQGLRSSVSPLGLFQRKTVPDAASMLSAAMAGQAWTFLSPLVWLREGTYRLELDLGDFTQADVDQMVVEVLDHRLRPVALVAPSAANALQPFPVHVRKAIQGGMIRISGVGPAPWFKGISMRPDVLASMEDQQASASAEERPTNARVPRSTYKPADVHFANGIVMRGYDLPRNREFQGGSLPIRFDLLASKEIPQLEHLQITVHLKETNLNVLAKGGYGFVQHYTVPTWGRGYSSSYPTTMIPSNVPPGRYDLWIGLFDGAKRRRIPIESANMESRKSMVRLPETVAIEPAPVNLVP